MEVQAKLNVDFKPAKRMKKRRELDALVTGKLGSTSAAGGGGSSSSCRQSSSKNGKHDLLLNESESSDIEEFNMPNKSRTRKYVGYVE